MNNQRKEERKCECAEMSCKIDCSKKHTCHTYSCEKCQPVKPKWKCNAETNGVKCRPPCETCYGGKQITVSESTQEQERYITSNQNETYWLVDKLEGKMTRLMGVSLIIQVVMFVCVLSLLSLL